MTQDVARTPHNPMTIAEVPVTAHNRNIAAASTTYNTSTNTATWTAAENVREIIVQASASSGVGKQNDDSYIVVINAPSAAVAGTWLADAGGAAQDIQYVMGHIGEPLEIKRTTAITRLDVLPIGADMRIVIKAGGV